MARRTFTPFTISRRLDFTDLRLGRLRGFQVRNWGPRSFRFPQETPDQWHWSHGDDQAVQLPDWRLQAADRQDLQHREKSKESGNSISKEKERWSFDWGRTIHKQLQHGLDNWIAAWKAKETGWQACWPSVVRRYHQSKRRRCEKQDLGGDQNSVFPLDQVPRESAWQDL